MEAKTTLTARCGCNTANYSITLPTAALPLKSHICNCSVCRYTTGSLAAFHAALPEGVEPVFEIQQPWTSILSAYDHCGANSQGKRLFCASCGAHVGAVLSSGRWAVATSLLDAQWQTDDTIAIAVQTFTESCPGGGLFDFLPDLPVWNPDPDSPQDAWADRRVVRPEKELVVRGQHGTSSREEEDRVRVECHCGGVSFTFPRPEAVGAPLQGTTQMTKFVSPLEPSRKWMACLDVCDDCRLVTGTHVIAWTFVPRTAISPPFNHFPSSSASSAAPASSESTYKALKHYVSSPGVDRYFCGTCGATVFFTCPERQSGTDLEIIDVALGLVRAPEGPLAEDWVTWRAGRLAWNESGMRFDRRLAEPLSAGHKAWGLKKLGAALDGNIG